MPTTVPIRAAALITALMAAVLGAGATRAQEGGLTGARLLERCRSSEPADLSWCVGFIHGVSGVIADPSTDARYRACFPPDLTSDIGRLVVVRGLEANDVLLDLPGTHAVWYALRKEFACPP